MDFTPPLLLQNPAPAYERSSLVHVPDVGENGAFSGATLVTMPLPRDPHIAEREELDRALATGTAEALLLFLERHPDSRYRPNAEAALKKLRPAPAR